MNALTLAIAAGIGAGLLAIPHCALMCGPLAAFACRGSTESAKVSQRFYLHQLGRLLGYVLVGALVGGLGARVAQLLPVRYTAAVLSWWFAAALAFAALRAWRATTPRSPAVVTLRRKNTLVTNVFARIARHPFLVGTATALLPCGAFYSALLLAAGTTSATNGGVLMASFALASGPGLAGAVWMAGRARGLFGARSTKVLAAALAVGAIVMIVRPIPLLLSAEPRCPACAVREQAGPSLVVVANH
ncbi:MAG: sulfite exporter TauE/SafE family protein [Sandaracinaceae bacterium]|nr:sulfite exporter TauE/SafE family protein [Sandaracinaceae bacterium]